VKVMLKQNFIELSAAVHDLIEKSLATMLITILPSLLRAVTRPSIGVVGRYNMSNLVV